MRRIKHSAKARSIKKVVGIAAPQVIAARTPRMPAAATNPGTPDRTEKVRAWESLFEMGAHTIKTNQDYARVAALQWWRLWTTPWWLSTRPRAAAPASTPSASEHDAAASKLIAGSRGPINKRATANARRLARTSKR